MLEYYAERTETRSLELADGLVSQVSQSLMQGVGERELEGESTRYTYYMPQHMPEWFAPRTATLPDNVSEEVAVLHALEALAREQDARVIKVRAVVSSTLTDVFILNTLMEQPVHDHRERHILHLHVVLEQE